VTRFARQLVMNVSVRQGETRSYAAELQRGEHDAGMLAALDLLHPEVTFSNPLGEVYESKLNWVRYAGQLLEALGEYSLSLHEVTDLGGDEVLAEHEVEIRGATSGIAGRSPLFVVFTVRDRLISRMVEYVNRGEALKAVRLKE
jgi:SnoaL-like domain